jgi:HEAT repeat protein
LAIRASFPEECCDALLELVRHDPDSQVMVTALFALGHLRNPRCQPDLIKLRNHPNDMVRYGVAFSFGEPQTDEAVRALLELMTDTEVRARDWATTYVGGTTDLDGPEIRAALLANAADEDELVRAEALHGLARRKDQRAVPHLVAALSANLEHEHNFLDAAKCYLGLDERQKADKGALVAALKTALGEPPSSDRMGA